MSDEYGGHRFAEAVRIPVQGEQPLVADESEAIRISGRIKWFDVAKGYGFVNRGTGTPDIFVHMETLRRCNVRELVEGQRVRVRVGDGPKGELVAEIAVLNS